MSGDSLKAIHGRIARTVTASRVTKTQSRATTIQILSAEHNPDKTAN